MHDLSVQHHRSGADHSAYYQHSTPNLCIYLVAYVDDNIITSNDHVGITNLKHLFQYFQTKDLDELTIQDVVGFSKMKKMCNLGALVIIQDVLGFSQDGNISLRLLALF